MYTALLQQWEVHLTEHTLQAPITIIEVEDGSKDVRSHKLGKPTSRLSRHFVLDNTRNR
jgi:hypothetical protein